MSEIYYGRGYESLYDDYMDFINYVFGFNGNQNDFKKLLPKMYKPEDKPVNHAYIALDDGKIKSGIGTFDHSIIVCGREIKCRGVGNVAVHPYARSRGYMRKLLNIAVDDMVKDGIDLSILGGRRQRYNYFSFETTGQKYNFSLNDDNMRHTFGIDRTARHTLDIMQLKSDDDEYLDCIEKLEKAQSFYPVRPRERLYDYLVSWKAKVYVFVKNGSFAGYVIYLDKTVYEIMLKDEDDFRDAIVSFYDYLKVGGLSVYLPPFCKSYIKALYRLCESYRVGTDKMYSVLNYKNVIEASMDLKATYTTLPCGSFAFLVHGRAGDERLRLAYDGDKITVENYDGPIDAEYQHIDAENMLFSPICPGRDELNAFAKALLPLPLNCYYADEV